ncbi:MAG: malonyl-ACP O-methyltransferase BioC [Methylococcales bacterium]
MCLDKTRIKRSFAKASGTYDKVAELQRSAGRELLRSVDVAAFNGVLLDLGCGTGFLSSELLACSAPETLVVLDIALAMVQETKRKLINEKSVRFMCADAEYLPIVSHSFDTVLSNLVLQWCHNLEAVFKDIKRVLKLNGQFIFSTFGPQTLCELKNAWASVDDFNHVNSFYSQTQLIRFLEQAGFKEIELNTTLYTPRYESVGLLMQSLKQLGAQQVIEGGRKSITTKSALQQMMAAYEIHRVDGVIPATFEVFNVIAKV